MTEASNNQQGTEAWLNDRLGIPTASRYADVLARGRNGTISATRENYKVELALERLTGRPYQRFTATENMQWGSIMEDPARLQYELQTGNQVRESGFRRHEIIETGASPDGLIDEDAWRNEGAGGVEIKSRSPLHHLEALRTRTLPSIYKPQVQGNLMNHPEREWWDWVSYEPNYPPNAQLVVIRCYRDEEYIMKLEAELTLFNSQINKIVADIEKYGINDQSAAA